MDRLETKIISGHTYYYYSKWEWVNGKCRRVWQKYLGKLQDIAKACDGGGPAPLYAEVFQWGLPTALWNEVDNAQLVSHVDALCPKRDQGLSTGQYIALAALNRAIRPSSKRAMWGWFSQTSLIRQLPDATREALRSQRFWDHMDRVGEQTTKEVWKNVIQGIVKREALDLSSVSYDGTNFYTFIDTFNVRCEIAKRGKNKQGQSNLRQVSFALFCCADGHTPLFYDVYEGNRNDAKEFPIMLNHFNSFLRGMGAGPCASGKTTLVFDKGNNSPDNFKRLDRMKVGFVGSVKLGEHKELAEISNQDPRFQPCQAADLTGTKAFSVKKTVYGKRRLMVISYNQNLFDAQYKTLQQDLAKALEKLADLQQKLNDRRAGLCTQGKTPTADSVENQVAHILSRQHLSQIIQTSVSVGERNIPLLDYQMDTAKQTTLLDTLLGKNILITNRLKGDHDRIIHAYRSQFIIENVFKEMKDRTTGNWWPMNHWTDSKIHVHGLYCTMALLIRSLMWRRVHAQGIQIPMKRLLAELDALRLVVNFYPKKRNQKNAREQLVRCKTSELQDSLIKALALNDDDRSVLG